MGKPKVKHEIMAKWILGKGEELEPKLAKRQGWNLNQSSLALKSKLFTMLYHGNLTKGHYCCLKTQLVPPKSEWINVDKQMSIGDENY